MLAIALLGPVEATRDGSPVGLPAGKTTELLARLAIDPGVPVRVDVLVEDLWSEPTARNTLQSKVSQLRRALADKDVVRGTGDAYVLDVPRDAVDAVRAVELAATADEAREAGDHAATVAHARAGLDLYAGEVLALAGPWAAPHRTRLEETRWRLVETLMAARVDLGSGGELVAELERLVEEQPLRERLWVALVTALYRAGRQADALAAYGRVRRHLVTELGIDPGPELRAVERQVLEQSADLDGGRRAATLVRPGNVGSLTTPLVGRAEDLVALTDAVTSQRLVTLVGPAGVGKTRLASEVAAHAVAPGGAWLVRFDTVDATADLTLVVAETLHVSGGAAALRERLSGAETLLLLDNCEHVIDAVADLVRSLLDDVPVLRVLATSQTPLGLEDEDVHPLAPLSQQDSVELFSQRARRMRKGFIVDDDNEAVVEEVCQALDGLPLAIELAAARVRSLPVEEIARRLDDRFALLRDPGSRVPERRRALQAALDWSYELLFPDDQRGLWALSCFAGGATIDALERVLTALSVPAGSVLDVVTRLVDRSLVTLDTDAEPESRYRLLDSVKALAAAKLDEAGLAPAAAAAHAEWYADRADWCEAHVRTADQSACLAFARAERADVDAALAWTREQAPELGRRIALGLAWVWVVLGDGTAGATRVRGAVGPDAPVTDRIRAGLMAGWLETSTGDLVLADADLHTAADLALQTGDRAMRADVHNHRAFLAIQQGRPDQVRASAADALALLRETPPLGWSASTALLLSAYGALMMGDAPAARAAATEAVDLLGPSGDAWAQVHAQGILGGLAQAEGRYADAAVGFEGAADAAVRLGFQGQAALHRVSLARVLARTGDPRARATFEQAATEAAAVADGRLGASVRFHRAQLLRLEGSVDDARVLLEENVGWYADSGGGDHERASRIELASVVGDADALAAELAEARESGDTESVIAALDGLARVAAEAGDRTTAGERLAAADDEMAQAAYLIDHTERYDAVAARALLG
ncbi:BTAD domain-containing putative transcriptional regulator [Nocardioides sp.]|uniref:BTAD domain-containing putative transcriptional regulator n=1 Tax=Nocardioides sp. TaxID=35761 RepID=UPI003784FAD8